MTFHSPKGEKRQGDNDFIKYLLVEQGVHIAKFHFLENLARGKVYEFCYIASTNKIAGTTAGFLLGFESLNCH